MFNSNSNTWVILSNEWNFKIQINLISAVQNYYKDFLKVSLNSSGSPVLQISAKDRDSGDFGVDGIVYELTGSGSEMFSVDTRSGQISVAPCPSPGSGQCLDYEQTRAYFLSFSAIDDNGQGRYYKKTSSYVVFLLAWF